MCLLLPLVSDSVSVLFMRILRAALLYSTAVRTNLAACIDVFRRENCTVLPGITAEDLTRGNVDLYDM